MLSILTSFDELNFSLIGGHWVIRRGCAPGPPGQIQKRPQGDFECLHHTSDPLPKLKLGNYGDGLQNHPA